jgi:hypothetical protein
MPTSKPKGKGRKLDTQILPGEDKKVPPKEPFKTK